MNINENIIEAELLIGAVTYKYSTKSEDYEYIVTKDGVKIVFDLIPINFILNSTVCYEFKKVDYNEFKVIPKVINLDDYKYYNLSNDEKLILYALEYNQELIKLLPESLKEKLASI